MSQGLDEGKSSYQGRSLGLRVNPKEKSAEVIVLGANEPPQKAWRSHKQGRTERKKVLNFQRNGASHSPEKQEQVNRESEINSD